MMMVTRSLQLFVSLVCSLTFITIECAKVTQSPNIYNVTKTIVHSAVSKGAVCLDGSPPAYYFVPGFGEGVGNWIVQLSGGAWCKNVTDCQDRSNTDKGSSKHMGPIPFQGIHSKNQTANPDFYNWNKVIIAYCDGGSFTGDVEYVDPATNLHFRGARIFTAVMDELLAKGLKNAKNESAKTLPKSCTSKMKPELCLFAENIQQDIKTPIFILMSAFDNVETQYTLEGSNIYECIDHGTCTTSQNNTLKEMRSDFLNALPKGTNPKHRGVFIDVVHHHTSIIRRWTPEIAIVVHNVSAPKTFADWYFDRNYTYLIDERDLPLPNLIPNVTYSS
ncbi:hypothetical protein RND71_037131 [Anisodus tanguticus]|uniref:Pectin acetylesterase n=1 Tax=Anisodus tanguticus TaxID=243964 RepID=A0AAE1R4Y9_9SOLA|nr:hypothetical protein RND71_037131 [Anisodus tanguticus]